MKSKTPFTKPNLDLAFLKSFLCLFVLSILSFANLNAEPEEPEDPGYYLYVEALEESPLPLEESSSNVMSTNEELNYYFEAYGITQFVQSFPNAKNPELASYYEIHAEGDIQALNEYIINSSYFGQTHLVDYPTLAACPNPVSINDYWIVNNWANNYALDLIEAECAWTITTGNNIEVAVIDTEIDTTHEDLINQINRVVGPYHGWKSFHGTITAGMVAAETNNGKGVAGIGYNTKIAFYRTSGWNLWQQIWQAYQDGSRIINVSWSAIGGYPNLLAVQEMIDEGTVLTLGAGNTPNANFHGAYAPIDGAICVSGVGSSNTHGPTGHARNSHIDLCAPSANVTSTHENNTYGGGWGTSFAAPQVAGTAALMRSVNPCLAASEIENILKVTCDTIADGALYPGLLGAGRLNAYRAVEKAQNANSATLDLYIKDRYEDFGISGGYHWQATRDNSPDIWVRNQQDGRTNQVHQDPEFQNATPVYVYVRVRNKSCATATTNEVLRLYWSKASSWSSWPQNWDGTSPLIGDLINGANVDGLLPGKDTIMEFTWNILNPNIHNNWATCLLARIESSTVDPITVYPGRIDDDVYFNNNIALKNITIIDNIAGAPSWPIFDNVYTEARGRYLFIGAADEEHTQFNIQFTENQSEASLSEEAEIKIYVDDDGWELLLPYVEQTEGIEPLNEEERSFLITAPDVVLQNVDFSGFNRIPIYVGFNFLTEEAENTFFTYQVQQFFPDSSQPLGGEYFEIHRTTNNSIYANTGEDQIIPIGSSTVLKAEILDEPAIYKWYNNLGELIHEGTEFSVEPTQTETYQLEVVSKINGNKDYDEVQVQVTESWIKSMDPNPSSNKVKISFKIDDEVKYASLVILNHTATFQNTYEVSSNEEAITINLSDFSSGIYSVSLMIDGRVIDSELLTIF